LSTERGMDGQPERHAGFSALIAEVRPALHRYCSRMTGSVADGEDVVQESIVRAYAMMESVREPTLFRAWIFRVAHNRAIDFLRGYGRRHVEPLDDAAEIRAEGADPDAALTQGEAVRAAVSRFLELPPLPRSAVILKDVLEYPLSEIASILGITLAAAKAALHRGRSRLQELSRVAPIHMPARTAAPALLRYAALFNARDWDGVRAMLVEDVRLEVVLREKRAGRREVSHYFGNYGKVRDWRLVAGWLDGKAVLAVFRTPDDLRPGYFIEIALAGDKVALIRDFRYVPYIGRDARIEDGDGNPMVQPP
jgi:RNA polymerase sigma factor (sigma-70 family)